MFYYSPEILCNDHDREVDRDIAGGASTSIRRTTFPESRRLRRRQNRIAKIVTGSDGAAGVAEGDSSQRFEVLEELETHAAGRSGGWGDDATQRGVRAVEGYLYECGRVLEDASGGNERKTQPNVVRGTLVVSCTAVPCSGRSCPLVCNTVRRVGPGGWSTL